MVKKIDDSLTIKILKELQTIIPEKVSWRLDGDVNLVVQGVLVDLEYFDITTDQEGLEILSETYGPAKSKQHGKYILITIQGVQIEVAAYDDGLNLLKFAKPHVWFELQLTILPLNWAKVFYEKIPNQERIDLLFAHKKRQRLALRQLKELAKYGEPERLAADDWAERWQTLIAILMSARTRDDVTIGVGEELFAKYQTLDELANAKVTDITKIIKSINYYQNKAEHIQQTARLLVDNFFGRVPETIEELVTLPGVGRKTANVFLATYGHPAIGVDTHVQQVAKNLKWSTKEDPDGIEQDLKNIFPRVKWRDVNTTCVLFGRTNQSPAKKEEIYEMLNSYAP